MEETEWGGEVIYADVPAGLGKRAWHTPPFYHSYHDPSNVTSHNICYVTLHSLRIVLTIRDLDHR